MINFKASLESRAPVNSTNVYRWSYNKQCGKRIKIGVWSPFIFLIQSVHQQGFTECVQMPDTLAGPAQKHHRQ